MTASGSRPPTGADALGSDTEVVSDAKAALRRRIRADRRARLEQREHHAAEVDAEALAQAVLDLVSQRGDGRVCVVAAYEARPAEPPTHQLLERLAAAGHRVLVPVTRPDLDLDWRDPDVAETADRGAYQGLQAISKADVVVVPALAVDRSGHRLGQGGGSYDRALARLQDGALVVALVHDSEVLDAGTVPVDAHDAPVHVVVTPSRGAVSLTPPD